MWTTVNFTTLCGFISAFAEGPLIEQTFLLQRIKVQNANNQEPYERYKALSAKASDINNQHLAELERNAIQFLADDRDNHGDE